MTDHRSIYEVAGVGRSAGESYERLLRDLLIVDEVPAWWTNRLKRLIRGSKRYLVDAALVMGALRVDATGVMRDGDLLGRIIDTFAVAQLRAQLSAAESEPRWFHLRREKREREVGVLVEYGGGRVFAFEIKATSSPREHDARHLCWLRDELADRFIGGAVLHTGPRRFQLGERVVAAPLAALWS